jgi:L-rhamnose mutarotase
MDINNAEMNVRRLCFALDLKNDPRLIREYEVYHESVWPEIISSIKEAGILSMEIYRIENRLFMIMEVDKKFSQEEKSAKDAANPMVQNWETLMSTYQQALPTARPGEKWMLMTRIFDLSHYQQ